MTRPDPGSFRDPASHIVVDDDRVLRLLDERGLAGWRALSDTDFFHKAVDEGLLIESKEVDATGFDAAGALEHLRLPFISYPYEWTFSMLRDAALLQLDLLERALQSGLTIKDATPFNVQFIGGKPVFIDIGSFEAYTPGEPWIGYRQFTRQFLFPLMMRAWAGIPFQPWLRGNMEGPTAAEMKALLPRSARSRPTAMMHVSLQARMEERMSGAAVRGELRTAGFSADLILTNVRKLRKTIAGLIWDGSGEGWVEYDQCTHVGRDRESKGEFLRVAIDRHHPERVLDLGANDGFFSEIAAQSGATAIAVDGDEQVLDALYNRGTTVSLVLADLTNPSPAQGWAGVERPSLIERANPDFVVAYGLIHHLIYTASIPPATVIDWLASFGCPVVVEFVSPEDEMVARLTANKTEAELHPGRTRPEFESLVARHFATVSTRELGGGVRVLYELAPLTA
ncbi:MAG TPA: class I SAM-dependent methyltransferase [Acidimicrobiia bacterium]|nr:class I SAM-dependent methyltransferase [Acidimicrobiia bacterium]